jgi:hypothetical protein
MEAARGMKNAVFWDVTPCGSCKNRRFGQTYRLHRLGEKNRRTWNLVTANVLLTQLTLLTVMTKETHSSETLVLTRTTRRNIPEDGILHSHRRENLKSYIALTDWTL